MAKTHRPPLARLASTCRRIGSQGPPLVTSTGWTATQPVGRKHDARSRSSQSWPPRWKQLPCGNDPPTDIVWSESKPTASRGARASGCAAKISPAGRWALCTKSSGRRRALCCGSAVDRCPDRSRNSADLDFWADLGLSGSKVPKKCGAKVSPRPAGGPAAASATGCDLRIHVPSISPQRDGRRPTGPRDPAILWSNQAKSRRSKNLERTVYRAHWNKSNFIHCSRMEKRHLLQKVKIHRFAKLVPIVASLLSNPNVILNGMLGHGLLGAFSTIPEDQASTLLHPLTVCVCVFVAPCHGGIKPPMPRPKESPPKRTVNGGPVAKSPKQTTKTLEASRHSPLPRSASPSLTQRRRRI